MKAMVPILVMSVALMSGACQKEEVLGPAPTKAGDMSLTADDIIGVQWTLLQLDGEAVPLSFEQPTPWFLLSPRSEVVGSTGCNELTGRYRHSGEQLVFQSLSHTQRFCADLDAMEDRYLQALQNTDHFRLEHDQLILMNGQQPLAAFAAQ